MSAIRATRAKRPISLLVCCQLLSVTAVCDDSRRLDEFSKIAMEARTRQDYRIAIRALTDGSKLSMQLGLIRRAALFENALCAIRFLAMDYSSSFRSCAEAINLALLAKERGIAGIAELNRSNFYLSLGDTSSAQIGLGRAIDLLERNSPYFPAALSTLGVVQARKGEEALALRTLKEAVNVAADGPDRNIEASAWSYLGAMYLQSNQLAEAEQAFLNVFRIRRLQRLPGLEASWRQLGELTLAQDRPAQAIRLLQHGIKARQLSKSSYSSFLTWDVMGRAFQKVGQRVKAREAFERAITESKAWRDEISPTEAFEIAADVRLASVAASFVSVSKASGPEAWESFRALELTRASGLRRQVLANRALAGQLSPEYLNLIRTAGNLRRLGIAGDRAATAQLRLTEFTLKRFESEFASPPDAGKYEWSAEMDVKSLVMSLAPGQVLITFLVAPNANRIWVLSRKGCASARLPDTQTLSEAVEAHRESVLGARDEIDAGHRLYNLLFSGIPHEILEEPDWKVVPDGPLWSVPWAALVPSVKERKYLVETSTVSLLPSANWLRAKFDLPASKMMVAAGNAIHNRADYRFKPVLAPLSASALFAPLWSGMEQTKASASLELPGLAGTNRELQAVCGAWASGGCTSLRGENFTLEALRKEIARHPAVIHLATHLIVDPTLSLQGARSELGQNFRPIHTGHPAYLALSLRPDSTREIIQPDDISRFYAPGALVVLSACGSGLGKVLPGAGLQGFGRAWLAAGARATVTTLWPVSDEASLFFRGFYSAFSTNDHPAKALRKAQIEALRRRTWQSLPRFWSAYMLLGKD